MLLKKYFWWERNEGNYNGTESETEYASDEDRLNMQRNASNETFLIFNIPNITKEENVIIPPGQGKILVPILSDDFCEEQALHYLHPTGKFCYKAPRHVCKASSFYKLRNKVPKPSDF